jgi:REP element-mobilizing transposase RayT
MLYGGLARLHFIQFVVNRRQMLKQWIVDEFRRILALHVFHFGVLFLVGNSFAVQCVS